MNLNDLKKEIPYKWKPGRMNNKTGTKSPDMAYIDARDVMDLLDEVVGAAHWQKDYKMLGNKMYCGIGIEIPTPMDETGKVTWEWVWKWDCGVESDFEAEKGEASDSFKRAAVNWGVGRFLYDLKPTQPRPAAAPARPVTKPIQPVTPPAKGQQPLVDEKFQCSVEGCTETVTAKIRDYSMKNHGKVLCMKHQLGANK